MTDVNFMLALIFVQWSNVSTQRHVAYLFMLWPRGAVNA